MWEKLQAALPGAIVSIAITLFTLLVTFNGKFSAMQAQVNNNTELVKQAVPRTEFERIEKGQDMYNSVILQRIEKIDNKVDQLLMRGK